MSRILARHRTAVIGKGVVKEAGSQDMAIVWSFSFWWHLFARGNEEALQGPSRQGPPCVQL